MDVILMSHVFDWFNDTDALLKEVSTVLRHDGKLIVTGFSSGRFRARSLAKCYLTKPIRLKLCSSVMLLLQNAGFEICEVRHYGFFAIKNKILAKYINAFCNRILPAMACGYMIVAQKKVLSAIAEKPEWPKPLLDPKKITVPTYRVKNKHE
jgi:ubiquinone/menaquinone biosynthesis C-methylase UbiE